MSIEATLIGLTRPISLENRINCIRGVFFTSNDLSKEEVTTRKKYLHELKRVFKRDIWPFRCEVVNDWEKDHDITVKKKREKSSRSKTKKKGPGKKSAK